MSSTSATQPRPLFVWGGLAVVLTLVSGAAWYVAKPADSEAGAPAGGMAGLATPTQPWGMGNPDAALRIVEFGDYQCGACGYYHPIMKAVMAEFGDRVYFEFRHFPLPSHPFARTAARAAEAAGRQGQFWEMHDLIMSNQAEWATGIPTSVFLQYARRLGLNDVQFQQDLRIAEIQDRIEKDFQSGVQLNLRSVPSFFFNGELIQNPPTVDGFKDVIRRYLGDQVQ